MKNLKSKNSVMAIFAVIIISAIFLTGCSKQQRIETTENKDKQNSTTQQPNNPGSIEDDTSMRVSKDKMNIEKNDKGTIEHKMIKIPSAQCDICKGKISNAVKKVNGVKSYDVDLNNKVVHVNFDNTVTDLSKIEKAITMAGFDANNRKADPDAYSRLDDCCKKPEDRKNEQ